MLAYVILLSTFIGLSIVLFKQYQYAEFIYPLIPIFFAVRLGDFRRAEFLKICFTKRQFYLIRILENVLLSIPFVVFLLLFQHYLIAFSLVVVSIMLSLWQWKSRFYFVLPTPFKKYLFEFAVGFRKTVVVLIVIYFLAIVAIKFDNFNLGVFSLILGFLTSMSYYATMEDKYYVWSHVGKPKLFLINKFKIAIIYNSLLYFPLTVLLSFFFVENIVQIVMLYGVGTVLLLFMIFIKYSAFPHKIGFRESIILAITIYFPPLILITIPYFYYQSIKSLSQVLK